MVKKVFSFSLILLIMFLCYQFVINYFKTGHSVTYTINDILIDEDYINDKEEYYLFRVTLDKDKVFVFENENLFNKQKEVVEDVKVYTKDDIYCVSLKYKKIKEPSVPECYINDVLYSYNEASKKTNLEDFTKELKISSLEKYSNESEKREEVDVTLNNDYLEDNEVIILYDYKTINLYDKKFERKASFSNFDNYKNIYGTIVGHYYLIPRLTSSTTFNTFVKIELNDGVNKDMNTIYTISKQSYVNGVYDDKLYIFDKSNLKQYEINPATEEIKITGDEENPCFAYINGEKTELSVYEMNDKEIKFSEKTNQFENIDSDEMFVNKKVGIYKKDDKFYKVYTKYPDNPILLFIDKDAKEIKVKGDSIYYLKNDSIYRYNIKGNVILLTRNELKYNSENAFDIYLK